MELSKIGSGKVRDLYAIDDQRLLLVASDRISAYDVVLPDPIPDKGRVLTGLSLFFFDLLDTPNHLLSTSLDGARRRRRHRSRVAGGQVDDRPPGRGDPGRMRRPRIPVRIFLARVSVRRRAHHRASRARAWSWATSSTNRSSLPRPRRPPATTRTWTKPAPAT